MAYSSRDQDTTDRYKFQQDSPTISKLVKPSDGFQTAERRNTDNPYVLGRQNDDRYTTDTRRTGDGRYERFRRDSDDQHRVQRQPGFDNRQETDRRNNNSEYTRRVPTAHVIVDPIRRPAHGNARTCVMEINIAVSVGNDRSPRVSFASSNVTTQPSPPIRSTALIEDGSYVDLDFQGPGRSAQISTDGFMQRSPSQKSGGFRYGQE